MRVAVRIRPLFGKEIQEGRQSICEVEELNSSISIHNPKADAREPPKSFTFDHVYSPTVSQMHIYETAAAPIVDSVMEVRCFY